MESGRRKLVLLLLTLLSAGAAPPADGAAAGALVVNGERIVLGSAYARAERGLFDHTAEDLHILLADVPLDEATRTDGFALARAAREGRLHAIEVVVDAHGEPISGTLYLAAFNGMVSATGMHHFEAAALERTRVAGRLWTDGAHTFEDVTFSYDVTFSAAIPRPPTAEELAAQVASPPANPAAAYVAAVLAGDLDRVRAALSKAGAAAFQAAGAERRLAQARAEMPADAHVVSVRNTGPSSAEVTVQGTRDGIVIELPVPAVLEDGAWRVTPLAP